MVVVAQVSSADGQPSMRQIMQISKNRAKHASPLNWKCLRKDGFYTDEKQLSFVTLDSQGQIAEYEVLLDPVSSKYKVRENVTAKWIDGANDHVSFSMQHAFDGGEYQSWKREQPGKKMLSDQAVGEGQISNDLSNLDVQAKSFSTTGGFMVGIQHGIPGFIITHTYSHFGAERISEVFERWEKEKRVDSIKSVGDKFEITAMVEVLQGSTDFFLRVVYDPASNTIENGVVFSRFQGREHVMTIYEVDFRTNEQGIRVPETSKIIMPLDKRAIIVSYESFRFEENLPKESFQVDFPDGIFVEDYLTKKYYKTGDLFDEDKAIGEFIQRFGFDGNIPVQRMTLWRWLFMGIGTIMILIALYCMLMKRIKGQ